MNVPRNTPGQPAVKVALRADASVAAGTASLRRCLALAQALQAEGAEPVLLTRPGDSGVDQLCAEAGVPLRWLPASEATPSLDAAQTLATCFDVQPDVVVVDHQALDRRWHDALRSSGARVAVIGERPDRPLAPDWLIDPSPCSDPAAKYAAVLQRDAAILGGPRHALLDADYATQPRYAFNAQVRSIGIALSGGDCSHHALRAWQACRSSGFAGTIEIVAGRSDAALPALQAAAASDPMTTLLQDPPHWAAFHARHDLQIGAGSDCWERCCMGVPTVALICTDEQRQAVQQLARAGLVLALDLTPLRAEPQSRLVSVITRMVEDSRLRAHQAELGRSWVDGLGAARVARALLAPALH